MQISIKLGIAMVGRVGDAEKYFVLKNSIQFLSDNNDKDNCRNYWILITQ